jgi:DNA polymerase-3 subunit delta'
MTKGTTLAPSPRDNPVLRGHQQSESVLIKAANSGRLAHAWLLAGPRGIGKSTLAYRFARYLLSRVDDGGLFGDAAAADMAMDPDNPVFRRVASGGHPDLFTLARSVNPKTDKLRNEIVIGDVRAAIDFVRLTSGEGGWRVVIVDTADDMNPSSANAILKLLEEPPGAAIILLVSHAPGQLLATIRSRCRVLPMPPLDAECVRELLVEYRPELSPADIQTLASLADGSIGDALAFADAGGLTLYHEMIGLLAGLKSLDIAAVHALGDRLGRANATEAYKTFTRLLEDWLSRLARTMARGAVPAENATGENAAIAAFGGRLAQTSEVWEKVSRLFAQAERANLDHKQVVINAFLTMQTAVQS